MRIKKTHGRRAVKNVCFVSDPAGARTQDLRIKSCYFRCCQIGNITRYTAGMFRLVGRAFQFEGVDALGREINFQSGLPDIDLGDAFLLRTGLRF